MSKTGWQKHFNTGVTGVTGPPSFIQLLERELPPDLRDPRVEMFYGIILWYGSLELCFEAAIRTYRGIHRPAFAGTA